MGDIQQIIKLQTYSSFAFLIAVLLDIFFNSNLTTTDSFNYPNIIGLVLFLATVVTVLIPLKSFILDMKFALFKLLIRCCGAPFTSVAFVHILAADCFTSFNKVNLDLINSFCWVYAGGWRDSGTTAISDCNFSTFWNAVIMAFPYYLRFMQCLKRYYITGLVFPNIFNAFKYFLSILTIILSNFFIEYPTLAVPFWVIGFTSFFYNNYWDNYNDWGLWRRWDSQKRFLRTRLTFTTRFYYTVMILNFFLRLNSMGTLLPVSVVTNMFANPNLFLLLMQALEITRRFLWAIIRIEHEIFTNFENLRDFWSVPSVYYLNDKRKKRLQPI